MTIDFNALTAPFDEADIEWKPIAVSKKTGKALAAAYVTNRAIMDRLDGVCGPENWRNEYAPGPAGGILCHLSIRIGGEWVTKTDGAENTDVEPVKGGLSTSMRRAAVQWGIGRYLYRLPSQWVEVDEHGRFTKRPRYEKPHHEPPPIDYEARRHKAVAWLLNRPPNTFHADAEALGQRAADWPAEEAELLGPAIEGAEVIYGERMELVRQMEAEATNAVQTGTLPVVLDTWQARLIEWPNAWQKYATQRWNAIANKTE